MCIKYAIINQKFVNLTLIRAISILGGSRKIKVLVFDAESKYASSEKFPSRGGGAWKNKVLVFDAESKYASSEKFPFRGGKVPKKLKS